MASLSETLQQNKQKLLTRSPSGQLSEESPEGETEGIQSLSAKAGLAAPPLSPQGAAVLGATPKQQDMQGSKAQKTAALTLASQPAANLQTAVREGQARTQQTAQEQAGTQKSQAMKDLGAMGDRVNDFVNAQRAKLQAATPVTQEVQKEFQGHDLSTLHPLLEQLQKDPTNQKLMLQVNQELGYDISKQLDPAEINQLYQDSTSAIAQGGAGVVDDNLTGAQLLQDPKFGYNSQQLSQLLGVPEAQLAGMTVPQIRDTVSKIMTDEFSHSQELAQKVTSGELGGAERAEARGLGREASSTGVRASEADVAHLNKQIENADQVMFGGKQMSVEDILKDDNISKTITDYMNSAPGSAERAQLEKTEPALIEFINKNQAVLADAAAQLSGGAKTFQETQAANKALGTLGGVQLPDELAKELIPGYGTLQAERVDPSKIAPLAYASKLDPASQAQFATALATAHAKDPTIAKEVAGLTADELGKLKIESTDPNSQFNQYLNVKQANEKIQNLSPDKPNDIIQAASGFTNPKQAQDYLTQAKASSTLGFGGSYSADILDANGDGKIDDPAQILANMKNKAKLPTLKDAAAGNLSTVTQDKIQRPELSTSFQQIVDKLKGAAADGHVTGDELKQSGLSQDEMIRLSDTNQGKQNPGLDTTTLDNLVKEQATQFTKSNMPQIGVPGGALAALDGLSKLYGFVGEQYSPKKVDMNQVLTTADAVQKANIGHFLDGQLGRNTRQHISFLVPQVANMKPEEQDFILSSLNKAGIYTDKLGQWRNDPNSFLQLKRANMGSGSKEDIAQGLIASFRENFPGIGGPAPAASPAQNPLVTKPADGTTRTFDPATRTYKDVTTNG